MMKKIDPLLKNRSPAPLRLPERRQRSMATAKMPVVVDAAGLLSDLRNLIRSARQRIATAAYSTQTLLCWHIGQRLLNENLQGGRAAYGKQILVTVSRELTAAIKGAALAFVFADVDGNRPRPLCSHDRRGNCRATGATIEPGRLSCFRLLRHPGLQEIANLGIVSTLSTQFSRSHFIKPQYERLLDGSLTMSEKV